MGWGWGAGGAGGWGWGCGAEPQPQLQPPAQPQLPKSGFSQKNLVKTFRSNFVLSFLAPKPFSINPKLKAQSAHLRGWAAPLDLDGQDARPRAGQGRAAQRRAGNRAVQARARTLVQLQRIPQQHCSRCEREQQGGSERALRHTREQAGPPHYACRACSGPQSCADVGGTVLGEESEPVCSLVGGASNSNVPLIMPHSLEVGVAYRPAQFVATAAPASRQSRGRHVKRHAQAA